MSNHNFANTGLPLWQFVGLVVVASILVGAPTFACLAYHRRRARDTKRKIIGEITGTRKTDYELYHKHHPRSGHYYDDVMPTPPRQPRRVTSSGSNVPLLTLSPDRSRNPSRNVSSSHPQPQSNDQQLNAHFAQRTGSASSVAYPEAIHHAPGRGGYGTVGNIVGRTYTAAQRVYRGRLALNFWPSWMTPWFRAEGLSTIDEESAGSSRIPKMFRNQSHPKSFEKEPNQQIVIGPEISRVDTRGSVASGHSGSTQGTSTSGFSMRTPPTFDKVSERAGYNPNMARSLTRRLLKFGFDEKDGVGITAAAATTPNRRLSGAWKGRVELKRRASERRRTESGKGARLFSIQKKKLPTKGDGDEEDDELCDDYGDEDPEEGTEMTAEQDVARTSITDFAHAFAQNIVSAIDGANSISGTVRIHRVADPDDLESSPDRRTDEEMIIVTPSTTSDETSLGSDKENTDGMETPDGTIRGRRSVRDTADTPDSQKKRAARNTPKNSTLRISLGGQIEIDLDEGTGEGDNAEDTTDEDEFVDITKEVLGRSPVGK
ncbi:hypothetical protein ABW19_dt0202291 [Dactylella cylindrospora]|nr:hypothetical protein ABW19_dt0202291 [Dactylella cylindrospora]